VHSENSGERWAEGTSSWLIAWGEDGPDGLYLVSSLISSFLHEHSAVETDLEAAFIYKS
jgi:hypothetical protein